MNRAPDYAQWSKALENRSAHLLCFEAIGYARGYCDRAGVGSGDAVDFGHAFAVLVAARGSRPSIAEAWRNWCADLPIGCLEYPPPQPAPTEDEHRSRPYSANAADELEPPTAPEVS
ncbi:hypothetical protein OHB12_05205 [Nocardia sp. NBC_01730]|uniref:hypothetical protein n=1 Tax=Nocardia sp. NBC_01730 TaxID=2975998 RepID=UPI002E109698|nr:hypothetical protein OHB12_05205 [Nocardia sp. NBC_01730]